MQQLSNGTAMAWQVAAGEAAAALNQYIEKEHLLIGICSLEKVLILIDQQPEGTELKPYLLAENEAVNDCLRAFELDSTVLRRRVREELGTGEYQHAEKVMHRSEACKGYFNRAAELAGTGRETTCLHLMAAVLEEPGDKITAVLNESGVEPADLLRKVIDSAGEIKDVAPVQAGVQRQKQHTGTPFLDRYGNDLTARAREGKLGPFIGRRAELLHMLQTLVRSSKNNPVLVGEAGVGKTAVAEALALRAAEGKDPNILGGKRIVELNMGTLLGGTKYRGEFEERLTRIIDEVRACPEVILFIDELHNLIGAGRAEGSMDAANIMKPALARGDLRCIGATTIAEYRRYIESDAALERRFEKIIVNEPSPQETLEILQGLRPRWEGHHGVSINDEALQAAVELSLRFDADHRLPDKAIDLVDKAGARCQVPTLSIGPVQANDGGTPLSGEVTAEAIARVLAEKIGLPLELVVGHLEKAARSRLIDMERYLKERLIGQDGVVERVCRRLLLAHSGLAERRGPLAVFLFMGPTGVGKTELSRLLAGYLFGSSRAMIRMDMSEYMEEHSVAKLIGSPPGYVGHEEEGQLTGRLRTRPYSVVLLDEIEKAHPRIFDLFLQLFDEGRLTDAKGRTIDAKNAIFIMTSNILADRQVGFQPLDSDSLEGKAALTEALKKRFRAEFINRIDEQIVFRSLDKEDAALILKPLLEEVRSNLKKQYNVDLQVSGEAIDFILEKGYSFDYGARELQRAVERYLQTPLSQLIASGKLHEKSFWQVYCQAEELVLLPNETI